MVYVDDNSTTPVDKRVKRVMLPYFEDRFGNPGSLHSKGREARKALEKARKKVASLLNGEPDGVVFTGCATEANNQAIKGTAFAGKDENRHIITTKMEHTSVINPCKFLEKRGFEVDYLDVDSEGCISPEGLKDALRENTGLVSIIMANNEIGTIEPIKELANVVHEDTDAYFHTDAAQVPGRMELDVEELGVDMATINGHKMYGPKGIGALWIREGVKIDPLLHGGGQENGRRSGTENVPYIVGFGKAAELAEEELDETRNRLTKMQKKLIKKVPRELGYVDLNGPVNERLPGNVNFSFKGVEGEALLLRLDEKGIEASTGSACASKELEAPHVLKAIGVSSDMAHSSLRMSFGKFNDMGDVEKILKILPEEVKDLRSITAL